MVLDGAIHGANGPVQGHPPPQDSLPRARPRARAMQCHLHQRKRRAEPGASYPVWWRAPLLL